MPRLVDSNRLLLVLRDNFVLFFQSSYNTVHRVHEVLSLHELLFLPCRNQCCLVTDVRDISARESRGLTCQEVDIDRFIYLDGAEVNLENLSPIVQVGQLHVYLPVEASCPEQGFIEHVGTVRGRENNDSTVGAEAIHLGEELIQRILTLVVRAEVGVFTTGTAHGIDLVDEHDTGCLLLRLSEKIAYPRSTHSHEHFHEIGTGD